MSPEDLKNLVRALADLPKETEWVEFKVDKSDPEEIGKYLSALSNSAAFVGQRVGYIVWGIADASHEIVGTSFKPRQAKIGNEELESWLLRLLTPKIDLHIHEGEVDGKSIVVFEVPPATHMPVRFKETEFIRVGSYKKRLKDFPEKEAELWASFRRTPFECNSAAENVSSDQVLRLIDYPSYFRLTGQPLPSDKTAILERLTTEKIIRDKGGDRFEISNVGAILFAYDLKNFDRLAKKAARVIIYEGRGRTKPIIEQRGGKGYAVGFEGLISWINDRLPQNEEVGQALRKEVRMFPEKAIRELVTNALIHQDFNMIGSGPRIEIFSDRMAISNPGLPLIDPLRFIDCPPRSRNEILAGLMRRMNMCEERGSGIDMVIESVEAFQLPAPEFRTNVDHMVATLYAHKSFDEMDRDDRVRACYQHCCLLYVMNQKMNNESLRGRFQLPKSKAATISQVIAATVAANLIRLDDNISPTAKKHTRYVPFWV